MAQLTPRNRGRADRRIRRTKRILIHPVLLQATAANPRELAELPTTSDESSTFGVTEFTARHIVLQAGAACGSHNPSNGLLSKGTTSMLQGGNIPRARARWWR